MIRCLESICALSDERACDSAVQRLKHTGANRCHNDSVWIEVDAALWRLSLATARPLRRSSSGTAAASEVRDLHADLSAAEASSSRGRIPLHLSLLFQGVLEPPSRPSFSARALPRRRAAALAYDCQSFRLDRKTYLRFRSLCYEFDINETFTY